MWANHWTFELLCSAGRSSLIARSQTGKIADQIQHLWNDWHIAQSKQPNFLWRQEELGNGLRPNQCDCSISNLDQSEGRIWATWLGRVERVFWGLVPSLGSSLARSTWERGNRKWRHHKPERHGNRKWTEINDRPRGLTKTQFYSRSNNSSTFAMSTSFISFSYP